MQAALVPIFSFCVESFKCLFLVESNILYIFIIFAKSCKFDVFYKRYSVLLNLTLLTRKADILASELIGYVDRCCQSVRSLTHNKSNTFPQRLQAIIELMAVPLEFRL